MVTSKVLGSSVFIHKERNRQKFNVVEKSYRLACQTTKACLADAGSGNRVVAGSVGQVACHCATAVKSILAIRCSGVTVRAAVSSTEASLWREKAGKTSLVMVYLTSN